MTTSCKRAAELCSLERDAGLTIWQRLSLWFHLLICGLCRRFRRQQSLIEGVAKDAGQEAPPDGPGLPADARERINKALREKMRDGPPPAG
jgi:hypothetical protein